MECFASVQKTRLIFQLVSFGAILAWIVFGTYKHSPQDLAFSRRDLSGEKVGMKHLLSLSEDDTSLGEENCELLFENGSRIDNGDTEVCTLLHVL